MKIDIGQINPTVGDLSGNVAKMVEFSREAAGRGAHLIAFPELSVTGYPPRDLVEKCGFAEESEAAVERLALETRGLDLAIIAGYVGRSQEKTGNRVTNSAAILRRGAVILRQTKILLPNYDVFDEQRNFSPGEKQFLWRYENESVALTICEDAWNDKTFWTHRLYPRDPVDELMQQGASVLISINASPYHMHKRDLRENMFRSMTKRHGVPAVAVNQVGGNDQIVFDGSSFVMDEHGCIFASARSFAEDLVIADLRTRTGDRHADLADECEAAYEALVLGTRDYIRKC